MPVTVTSEFRKRTSVTPFRALALEVSAGPSPDIPGSNLMELPREQLHRFWGLTFQ